MPWSDKSPAWMQVIESQGREWDKAVKIGTAGSLYVLQSNLRQTSRR